MSDQSNPYSAPTASLAATPAQADGGNDAVITQKTKEFIGKAGPWATFLGIMGFIGSGFMVLAGLSMSLIMAVGGAASSAFASLGSAFSWFGGALGLFYIIIAAVLFFPSLFLVNIGSASRKYRLGGNALDLERFAGGFKKYVKFNGILYIAMFGLSFLAIIIAMVVAVAAASRAL